MASSEDSEFNIYVQTLAKNSIPLRVLPHYTIAMVKMMIQDKEDIRADLQRLFFNSEQLNDDWALGECGIQDKSVIFMGLRLRGMISTFRSHDESDPLIRYLLLPESERLVTAMPLANLQSIKSSKYATGNTFKFQEDNGVLTKAHLDLLSKFLDFFWEKVCQSEGSTVFDIRAVLPEDVFERLMAMLDCQYAAERRYQSRSLVQPLHLLQGRISKLALRLTIPGPTLTCINFHVDGGYASATVQIPLNTESEYSGGKLCFFVNDTVVVPSRTQGSLTRHERKVLHGVTALHSGVRKSLFVVDIENGLGETDVYEINNAMLDGFLATYKPPM